MEPDLQDDDWKLIENEKRSKRNRRISWVLIATMLIWAFFINGQVVFWELSGRLGFIPQEEVQYLVENIEYYYLHKDVFQEKEYIESKEKLLQSKWITSKQFETFLKGITDMSDDEYSYFYFDSLLDFRSDYSYVVENIDDGFEYSITEERIGYIHFTEFAEDTSIRFENAIIDFGKEGLNEIVIDLRGNPGGLLFECNDIADMLLPETEIISQIYNDGSTYTYYSDELQSEFDKIWIFLDAESASCSEMLALSLKTNLGEGVEIIGKNTVGKEVTQNVVESDVFHYALFIVASKWGVKDQTVKDLNKILDAYDGVTLSNYEDYYHFVLDEWC